MAVFTHRLAPTWLALSLAAGLAAHGFSPCADAAEKSEPWVEVHSPHFTVISNGSEKQARRLIDQFEQIRGVFHAAFPELRVDPGEPILILGAKNESSLKALLPEFWEKKGHTHPSGIFVAGHEKHYVALRLDVTGENPYHVIYHEYVHLLLRLNYRRLPVWLNEGLAEFYGNTVIGDKEVGLGRPDESHLQLLNESKLLPIEVLLKVDHSSPYYNEAEKTSIFYAQSWALVHYLVLGDQARRVQTLENFFTLLQKDTDEIEAARLSFGDLKKLQKEIESYARQSLFYYARMKRPAETSDQDYAVRVLSPAESSAVRGDFHLHMRRTAEARALLEAALRLDPNLAAAHESMGFLHFQSGEREQAAQQFAQAIKLDSKSYLAHYFHAMLMVTGGGGLDSSADPEASLRRAIELNANFAPAYATLAGLYAMHQVTLEKALEFARKAAQLEPGEPQYALQLGRVLTQMGRTAEAKTIGEQVARSASTPEIRAAAEAFLGQIRSYEESLAERKRQEEEERAAREKIRNLLKDRTEAKPATGSETPASGSGVRPPVQYGATGKITAVSCAQPPELEMTLDIGAMVLRLHAANSFKVDYLTTRRKPPANFNPCVHLKGLSAKISYNLVRGQSYDGEILTIEIQR